MLNESLYNALVDIFGEVYVTNEGKPGVYTAPKLQSSCFGSEKIKYGFVSDWGETYHVNCPICKDTRHRLYISHLFGSIDRSKAGRGRVKFGEKGLIHCHNEQCQKQPEMFEYIREIRDKTGEVILTGGVKNTAKKNNPVMNTYIETLKSEVVLPKGNLSFYDESVPDTLFEYLKQRDFDFEELNTKYLCRFLPAGIELKNAKGDSFNLFDDRLVFPIIQRRIPVAWQARRIIDDKNMKFKYLFSPGCKKHQYLYNMDRAWANTNVCICEGVTDVWRIGDNEELNLSSVALFGKTMSTEQIQLLATLWGYSGRAIVMLDPDAEKESNAIHRILTAYDIFPRGVYNLRLKKGDPADHSREELYSLLKPFCT